MYSNLDISHAKEAVSIIQVAPLNEIASILIYFLHDVIKTILRQYK